VKRKRRDCHVNWSLVTSAATIFQTGKKCASSRNVAVVVLHAGQGIRINGVGHLVILIFQSQVTRKNFPRNPVNPVSPFSKMFLKEPDAQEQKIGLFDIRAA
jgi:hypothetical protein